MKTIFVIGSKKHTLKYTRKMPEGEVKKMKSFVTNKGMKLIKTSKFKIKKVLETDQESELIITLICQMTWAIKNPMRISFNRFS